MLQSLAISQVYKSHVFYLLVSRLTPISLNKNYTYLENDCNIVDASIIIVFQLLAVEVVELSTVASLALESLQPAINT